MDLALPEQIRHEYIVRKKCANPKFFLPRNAKYVRDFELAAEICDALKAEPEIYIDAHVARFGLSKLLPPFLHSNTSESIYREFMELSCLDYDQKLDLFKRYVAEAMNCGGFTLEQALGNRFLNIDAWFRICITAEPNQNIITKYLKQAKTELTPALQRCLERNNLDYTRLQ